MKNKLISTLILLTALIAGPAPAATTVPTDAQMPGSQPEDAVTDLKSNRCGNCHGGYDPTAEALHTWSGSMMGHAGRDPIFWATLAIAEQDFDGAGDLCIRCHMPGGWLAGRSTPTDGSSLTDTDATAAVECDLCHRLTNPDNSEHLGIQNPPFVAQSGTPAEGHYGAGQYVIYNGNDKLGPYADAEARHNFLKSNYHRSAQLCGTCHDVSNPVVGDLAPNNGAQVPLDPGTFNGTPGGDVTTKAAFNNAPHKYGVVERTFSEHQASWFGNEANEVSSFSTLPADLQAGSIEQAFLAATAGGGDGSYEDGDPRSFTCQTCHMRPSAGAQGCNKNPRPRPDMPVHDLTGANYWMPTAIQYMAGQGTLRLGNNLDANTIQAMNDGILRAQSNLNNAASLTVNGNSLKVVNLTGHKLISGYPEGRRMWLNIKWFDGQNTLLREDGAYGGITVDINGTPTTVETLLDLNDPNTRVYESHGAITQAWAAKLLTVSANYATVPVEFDRITGAVTATIGDVANQAPGSYHESFHFVLNNQVVKDNRIPPYGMAYDASLERSILPVPATQYGNPGPGGTFNYWDDVALDPPAGATHASIELLYQPTSWEYIQFLYLANNGQNVFLAEEGSNMLDAWLNTGMATPYVMASATWGAPPTGNTPPVAVDDAYSLDQDTVLNVPAPGVLANDSDADNDPITAVLVSNVGNGTLTLSADGGFTYTPDTGFNGSDSFTYQARDDSGALSNVATVALTIVPVGGGAQAGVAQLETGILQGNGQNQTFVPQTVFAPGDDVVVRAQVLDSNANPVAGATVTIDVAGPENATLTSDASDAQGFALATWKTKAPKGNKPGTATGAYTAQTADVTAQGFTWDGVATSTGFTLQ